MADKGSKILGVLHRFFGLRVGEAPPQILTIQGLFPEQFTGDRSGGDMTHFEEDRVIKYFEYDSMDSASSDISVALDIYAEEATQRSMEHGKAVWVTAGDDRTKAVIERLFEDLEIEERIYGLARHVAKYGDLFLFPLVEIGDKDDKRVDGVFGDDDTPIFKKVDDPKFVRTEDPTFVYIDDGGDNEEEEEEADFEEEGMASGESEGEGEEEDEEDDEESDEEDGDNRKLLKFKKNKKVSEGKLLEPMISEAPSDEHLIQDFWAVHPSSVSIAINPRTGKVIGYACNTIERDTYGEFEKPDILKDKEAAGFATWEFIHFLIPGSNLISKYGTSMIEQVRTSWRVMSMLETAIALWRLNRAGNRLVYYIDVGTSSPDEAMEIVNKYQKATRQEQFLKIEDPVNPRTTKPGDMSDFLYHHQPYTQFKDLYWPMAKDSVSKVEVLQMSPDLTAIEDLEYYKNKIRTGLGIPKAYFDQDISGWNANKALAQQDIRFAKKVERLQRAVIKGLELLCAVQLIMLGHDEFQFTIHMEAPSSLGELQKLEVWREKISTATEMMGFGETVGFDTVKWAKYILKSVVGMSTDDIEDFMAKPPMPPQIGDPPLGDPLGDVRGQDVSRPTGPNYGGDPSATQADYMPIGSSGQDLGYSESYSVRNKLKNLIRESINVEKRPKSSLNESIAEKPSLILGDDDDDTESFDD